MIAVLLPFLVVSCGLTAAQRTELIDISSELAAARVTKAIQDEVVPALKEKAGEIMEKAIEKLELSPDKAKELVESAKAAFEEKLDEWTGEKLKEKVKDTIKEALEKAVPDAEEEGGVGGTVATILLAGLQLLVSAGRV